MKLIDYLLPEAILPAIYAENRIEVLKALSLPVADKTGISVDQITHVLMERERLGSTGIGHGIAVPHAKLRNIENLILGFGRTVKGIDFDAIDGKPVFIFFMLLSPDNSTGLHLRVLARISRLLKEEGFRTALMEAKDAKEIMRIIKETDEALN